MNKEKENQEEELGQVQENKAISPASEHLDTTYDKLEVSADEITQKNHQDEETTEGSVEKQEPVNKDELASQEEVPSANEESTVVTDKKEELHEQSTDLSDKVEPNVESKEASSDVDDANIGSEEDLSEKNDDHHDEEEHEEVDYTSCSKEELVEHVKEAGKMDNVIIADKILLAIKPFFDEIREKERDEAFKKFVADGGAEDDFEFRNDELNTRFDANYRLIKDKKTKYFKEKEKEKEDNLKKKEELLEELREFIDSDETNISFDAFKEIQDKWKNVGMVPASYNRTLWANYNALLDRFYDKRSIYFELKELDRKKNLESKLELCDKAEALLKEENIKIATQELNELHHEFKHIGPVPKEDQEPLWQRFKAASDAIYDKRKDFVDQLKSDLDENLVKKTKLSDIVQEFTAYNSDRIKEWNEKTNEILDLQKQWEAIGGLPREKGKEINKRFWSGFKTFFHNKGEFFKRLDEQRGGNLTLKQELVEKVEELKESTDWIKTANAIKKLQQSWKEIGPVPEKHRNEIYKKFKAACDYFFEQKRAYNKEAGKEYEANLLKKEAICEEIEKLANAKSNDLDMLRELQDNFEQIGFVPKQNISAVKSKYAEAIDRFVNSIPDITNEERHQIRVETQINKMMSGPNSGQKIFRKEQHIRKQIGKIENDIALWKNNLEFFAASKTADKLRDEFQEKIDKAGKELKQLKQELRLLRSIQ